MSILRAVRVSVGLPQHDGWPALRAVAREAEAAGFDELRLADHLSLDGAQYEGFTGLAAIAAATERIDLCLGVATATFRPPGLLAKLADSLDRISGGRFRLGIGAGADRGVEEHAQYGIAYPSPGERVRMLRDSAEAVRRLCERPVPLVIGSSGDRALRIVVRYADEWNCGAKFIDRIEERVRVLESLLGDRGPLRRSVNVPVVLGESRPDGSPLSPRQELGLRGDVDAMIGRARDFRDLGFDTIWLAISTRAQFDRCLELLPGLKAL